MPFSDGKPRIVVLGAGGHARSIIDAIESSGVYDIVGLVAPKGESGYRKYEIIGSDFDLKSIFARNVKHAAMGLGFLGNSDLRERLYQNCLDIGFDFPAIVDPTAVIAMDAQIQDGAFVGKLAVVNSAACIEPMSIVNTGALVDHDSVIGRYSHLAPGSVVCGNVRIAPSVFIGAGSTVINDISIGEHALIGAGSVVLKNLPPHSKVAGNPARAIG